jgi:hypothetical protein
MNNVYECIKEKYHVKKNCQKNYITFNYDPCVIGWEYENIKTVKLRSTRMWLKHKVNEWSDWRAITQCSKSCDGGIRKRTRSCNWPDTRLPSEKWCPKKSPFKNKFATACHAARH